MPDAILDAILDEGTTLDDVHKEIERLKLEAERTKCHHAAQLRAANKRQATKVENLQQELVVVQIAHVVPTSKSSRMPTLDTKRRWKRTKGRPP